MNKWTWDRQQNKFVPDNSGRQSGPNGQPQGQPPGNWGQWPPAGPNQAPAYGPYSQPGAPLGPYGGQSGPYGQPQGQPPGNWGQWPPAGPNQAPAYGPYSQPGGPLGPYAGQTGFPHQQYSQNSLLGMPPDHLSNAPSNQNQQREMGMRQGPGGRAGDHRSDHRGRGRGRGRRRGQGHGGRKRNNTDEKNYEAGSDCGNEENDESEEDSSDSDDTEIAEKHKPKNHDIAPTEPPEENEVFEYLIKEVGGPISVKNIATKKLFPEEFDIPSWFRSHQRRFIMFENKEKNYQFIVPFYREATFCLDYNHLGQQKKCDQSDCPHAHICKYFIDGCCKEGQKCPLSHSFYDRANAGLISKLGLDIFSNEEIRLIYNQRFPHVCGKHAPTRICRLPACAYLHICIKNLFGKCENGSDCKLSHTFETEQNKSVLKAYQIADWNEPLKRKVIFLSAITTKENTDQYSKDKRSMSHNRFSRRAESTSDLQNEQKNKSQSRSESIDARNLHRGSLDALSNKSHGYNIDDEEQMNSKKEERNLQKDRIQRGEKSLKPKSGNPIKNDGGKKTEGPRPRNKLNNEEDKTSADAVLKTDVAQSTPICDLYLVDNCKTATCKLHHHDSIKLPYIWQIQIFNSWLTLNKLAVIEVEKAFCQKSSTIQTSIDYEGRKYNVKLELDTMTTVLTDSGSSSFTMNTSARRLSTKSFAEGAKPSAEDSFKTQWRWFFTDELGSFCLLEPELLQFTLEQKFTRKCQDTYMFFRESYKFRYRIDFIKMEQMNIKTEKVRKLLRRPLFVSAEDVVNKQYPEKIAVPTGVKVPLPVGWVPWDLAHAFELVELKQTSAEFKKVECSFLTTLTPSEIQINYIYRVQNRELWMAYDGQRKSMKISLERAGQAKEVDERSLFHGTNSIDTVQGICTNCFDFRVCGKHGTRYGKGAYFARDAKYSHCYTSSSSTLRSNRYMFLAKVLVGEYTTGSSVFTRPPEKPGGTAHQLFDSCVDIVDNPSIFVVFDLKQCYPEYLICYKNLEELSLKKTTMDRPSKSTTPSVIEQIQPLSLLNQSIEPKSKIHTRSSSVEKDNVLTRFDPISSLEKHEEETTIGMLDKNVRQLEVTRIRPSSSQDQWTPSASVMHRSSPIEVKSKIHTRSSSVEKDNVLTRFDPSYSHEKLEGMGKPEKNARQLEVTRIQPSSSQDQLTPSSSIMHRSSPIEVKSKIHTRSSSVEKDNVFTRFDPIYSLEKHEEEAAIGKPEKNARQLEGARIQPSSSQDQSTPSASIMHRSSPIEAHTVSGLSDPQYSRKPNKNSSYYINRFNSTISSKPLHLPLTDSPP